MPKHVDTWSNEMHHKRDKKSSKRTQKRPRTFKMQSLKQIEDRRVIDLGVAELEGRKRWDHFRTKKAIAANKVPGKAELSGVKAKI